MEKISWTDRGGKAEVLLRVKEQRNILHEISKRKANWIGHIWRRNCLLQRVIEGKIKGGNRSDGKTRKKAWEATGCPLGKERIRSFEGGRSRSHDMENWLWKRLWICRKTDC